MNTSVVPMTNKITNLNALMCIGLICLIPGWLTCVKFEDSSFSILVESPWRFGSGDLTGWCAESMNSCIMMVLLGWVIWPTYLAQ